VTETRRSDAAAQAESRDKQSKRRRRLSNALLTIGVATTLLGLATAVGGVGLILLFFAPIWFIAAAALRPTRWRIGTALFALGCWSYAAFSILT